MKCAILLASYNGEKYIKEQINSILQQKLVEITLFISDDCSSDETKNIIMSYNSNQIIVLPDTARMGSASQNFFRLLRDVDFTNFDYVSLADQDDIWNANKIYNAISMIREKELDGYASNVTAFWEDGRTKLIDKSTPEVQWDYLFGSGGAGCTIVLKSDIACNIQKELIAQRELSKSIGLHDWLIYAYVRANNLQWKVDPWSSMMYRQHGNNEFGANSGWETFVSRWEKARNGWYSEQILSVSKFCHQTESIPITYLTSGKYIDKVRLAMIAFKLRKRKSEGLVLALILLVPGFQV